MKIRYVVEADVPISPHRRSLYRTQLESMLDLFTDGRVRIVQEKVLEEVAPAQAQEAASSGWCSQKDRGPVQRDLRLVRP